MHRIDTNVSATLPTPAAAGTAGYFLEGGAGVLGTQVHADWCNAVQEELVSVLSAAGVSPQKASAGALVVNQVIKSIRRIASANVGLYSTTTTLTADAAGVVFVDATAGNVVLTLPVSNSAGGVPLLVRVTRVDGTSNTVTVQPQGSDAILPGTATSAAVGAYETVEFQADGSVSWRVLRLQDGPWTTLASGSGSITVPAGYTGIEVDVVGGGGGAAGSNGTYTGGGGGAGGTTSKDARGLLPGASLSYAVGAAGSGGSGAASGSDGSASTLSGTGISLTANGGKGGTWGSAPAGGAGGTATGGDSNMNGGCGTDGSSGANTMGGNGGASSRGGGGRAATSSSAVQTGQAPGSGGGAAYSSNTSGGAGLAGLIRYRWKA